MKNNKNYHQHFIGILFIIILLSFFLGCVVILPPIKGNLFYSDGKTPVKDAYVICFNSIYPLSEAINVGGANSDFHSVEVVKTNNDGKFYLSSYINIGLPLWDTREFLIYKPGYSVLRYFQSGIFTFVDMNIKKYPWDKKCLAKRKFVLSNSFDNAYNNIGYVSININYFADHFKHNKKEEYHKNLDDFRDIYECLIKDYEKTINMKTQKSQYIDNEIENMRYLLNIKK
ncbi:hypothetical protein DSCW_16270 [Desulfosarcina widdelii]|uniref:Lipoprotein n=1 Tax=Desulfosarcina widdelii TaxID=947919 RepID=A0A5K7Z0M5_9BACT|nr:hypothetical protein [Desulfosarcina widdelii]BBO74210.1 hypothetical protein DSCW_16270 [Desulfosarcina widdelii]